MSASTLTIAPSNGRGLQPRRRGPIPQDFRDELAKGRIVLKRGDEIGQAGKNYFYFNPCVRCDKPRWTRLGVTSFLCRKCAWDQTYREVAQQALRKARAKRKWWAKRGAESPSWRGGRSRNRQGYIVLRVTPEMEAFVAASIKRNRSILEHRYVMARHLGRPLMACETVHHKNGIKDDNRIENLEIWVGNHAPGWRLTDYLKSLSSEEMAGIRQQIDSALRTKEVA